MRKIIILLLCLLILSTSTSFAEVKKYSSKDYFKIERTADLTISGSNKHLYVILGRSLASSKLMMLSKSESNYSLFLSLFAPDQKSPPVANSTFTSKDIPYFLVTDKGIEKTITFKASELGSDYLNFKVNSALLQPLVDAEKVSIVISLKNGITEKINIPNDVLEDWKYILTCNLQEESKKGIWFYLSVFYWLANYSGQDKVLSDLAGRY